MKTLRWDVAVLAIIAFVGSACSILYELLIAETVSTFAGDPLLWESVTVGVYLAALGLGAYFHYRTRSDAQVFLPKIEFLLAVVGGFAPLCAALVHIPYRIYIYDHGYLRDILPFAPIVIYAGAVQILTVAVGVLSGFELPLILDLFRRRQKENPISFVLGVYYFGALAGTLAFTGYLMPNFTPTQGALVAGGLNLGILALCSCVREDRRLGISRLALGSVVLATIAWIAPGVHQANLKNFYYNDLTWRVRPGVATTIEYPAPLSNLGAFLRKQPTVDHYTAWYGDIDVVPEAGGEDLGEGSASPQPFSVHMNRHFQFSTRSAGPYHEHLVHAPVQFFDGAPRRVLVLGGGDGLAVREILKYKDSLGQVTLVDLNRTMIRLAREDERFLALNDGALNHEKVRIRQEDAFQYLRRQGGKPFDAIYIDFTFPFSFDSARLYSVEFFRLVAKRLSKDGYFAMASPIGFRFGTYIDKKMLEARKMAVSTLRAAGFETLVGYDGRYESFLAGTRRKRDLKLSFRDHGIRLEHFNEGFFLDPNHWKVLEGPVRARFVNSLFKPRFFGVEDTFF